MSQNTLKQTTKISYLLLCLLQYPSYALDADRFCAMQISAEYVDINQLLRQGTYTNDVILDQGTTHLRAAKAITHMNDKNKFIKATAYGDKSQQAHCWTTLDEQKPPLHAFADKITYHPEIDVLELSGSARIMQGKDSFSAPYIRYNTKNKHVVTKKIKNERTTIIIQQEKKK